MAWVSFMQVSPVVSRRSCNSLGHPLAQHPWFAAEVLPMLRQRVAQAVA